MIKWNHLFIASGLAALAHNLMTVVVVGRGAF